VIPFADVALSEHALRFEGRDHAADVSFFVTRHAPGTGPALHRHPYTETFVVQSGAARFTVDGETLDVQAGHIVVVPAGVPHAFVGAGEEELRQVSVNASDRMITEWL
jgi:mannose-6-phosphate isomerase-like protein (cupin superfamily)